MKIKQKANILQCFLYQISFREGELFNLESIIVSVIDGLSNIPHLDLL